MHAAPANVAGACRLLARNFRNRRIDAFDGRFDKLVRPAGAFVDPQSALRLEAWTAALRSGERV